MKQKPQQSTPSHPNPFPSAQTMNQPLNNPSNQQLNPHHHQQQQRQTNQFFIKPLNPPPNNSLSNKPPHQMTFMPFDDISKTLPTFESPKQRNPHQKMTGNILFTAEPKKNQDFSDAFPKDHQKLPNTDTKVTILQNDHAGHFHSLFQNHPNAMTTENLPHHQQQQQLQTAPGNNNSSSKKPKQNELVFPPTPTAYQTLKGLAEKPEVISIEETQFNPSEPPTTMIPEPTNPTNSNKDQPQIKTKNSLENYYQTLNDIPNRVQERLQGHKPPEVWDLGLSETMSFFKQLPNTSMDPEEFMNEEHHLEPQGLDLPNELLEDFTKSVESRTIKLHQDMKGIHDLFMYGQKVEKLFGDKTNESIHRTKEISSAFSGLSNYIWDCLQNQFQFPDGSASQESTMSFQDVAEKVTSQKFFAEINDDPATEDLLEFFHHLLSQPNDPQLNNELQSHLPELLNNDLLDQDFIKFLFGESFDLQNIQHVEPNKKPNPAEEELQNQYLSISQDLQQIPSHKMEEEPKNLNHSDSKKVILSPPSHHMSEEKSKDVQNQNQIRVTRKLIKGVKASTPQQTVTQTDITQPSMTNQSEATVFADHFMEFEEPFMPLGLEEEGGGFPGGFPFMSGESFPLGGFGSNEDEDIGSNNI